MQKTNRLTIGDLAATKGLDNTACDRMITTNRNRPDAFLINGLIELSDASDTIFIVIGFWKGHITRINDAGRTPRVKVKFTMHTPLYRCDIAYRPWA